MKGEHPKDETTGRDKSLAVCPACGSKDWHPDWQEVPFCIRLSLHSGAGIARMRPATREETDSFLESSA